MKKSALLLSLAAFILTLASCGGPEADAKKMIREIEKYTEIAIAASEDNKLDDGEIEELKKLAVKLDESDKELDEYKEANAKEIEKVYEEYFSAMMALYECKGSEKLEDN